MYVVYILYFGFAPYEYTWLIDWLITSVRSKYSWLYSWTLIITRGSSGAWAKRLTSLAIKASKRSNSTAYAVQSRKAKKVTRCLCRSVLNMSVMIHWAATPCRTSQQGSISLATAVQGSCFPSCCLVCRPLRHFKHSHSRSPVPHPSLLKYRPKGYNTYVPTGRRV